MHIIYFVQYFIPEKGSSPYLVMDLIDGMVSRNGIVDIYTSTPTRGVNKETITYYRKHRTEKLYGGRVQVHRMPLFQERKMILQRAFRFLIFSMQCFWVGLTKPADAIFCGSGPPTQGVVLSLLGKLTHKKIIYNLQDVFPESLVTTGITTRDSKVYKIGLMLERFSYKYVDKIITISEDIAADVKRKAPDTTTVLTVANWVDESIGPVSRSDNDLFERFQIPRDAFIVTYAGNIGRAQGVETILQAAEILKGSPEVLFAIFGEGAAKESCMAFAKEHELDNIRFLPLLSTNEVAKVYSLGDVSIVICRKGVGISGLPSKTWNIMATKTPIIVSFDKDSQLSRLVQESNCGIAVDAEDAGALAGAVMNMKENPRQRQEYIWNEMEMLARYAGKANAVTQYMNAIWL